MENFNLRKRVGEIVGSVLRYAARTAEKTIGGTAPQPSRPYKPIRRRIPVQHVGRVVAETFRQGDAKRNVPLVPGAGNGQDYSGYHPIDRRQQRIAGSRDARRGRLTTKAGTTPHVPHPELTVDYISGLHRDVDNTGKCERKADLDARILREDGHTQGCDRTRRAGVFRYPLRWKPRDESALARLVCNSVRTLVDDIDGFNSSAGELLIANSGGFGSQELIWRDTKIRIPTGAATSLTLAVEGVASLESVQNRWFRYDIQSDDPFVNMGSERYINPRCYPADWEEPELAGKPLHKFIIHKGYGDGPARQRGFQYANHYLMYLKGLSTDRWGILIDGYGVPTPYLQLPQDGFIQPEDIDDAEGVLENHGTGEPAIIPGKYGELKHSPVPSGVAPMHQGIIGYIETVQSKLILSATAQVETGNNGSYALSDVHMDQQEAVQQIDAMLEADTYRSQLARALVDVNAERFARAFAPYCPGGCSPDDIRALVPLCYREIKRAQTQTERMSVFLMAANSKIKGLEVDPSQIREEMQLRSPHENDVSVSEDAAPAATLSAPPPAEQERRAPIEGLDPPLCLMMLLPPDVSAQLDEHRLPGYTDPLHVTLCLYNSGEDADRLMQVLTAALADCPPLVGTIGGELQRFEGGAVWAPVEIPALPMARALAIAASLLACVTPRDVERDYVPHCTLGYSDEQPSTTVPSLPFSGRSLCLVRQNKVLGTIQL